MALHSVILAAGQGTRMHSDLPKVLHGVGGRPMLSHVVRSAERLRSECIHVVYGHGGDRVQANFTEDNINWVHQRQQLGTGHAVLQALAHIPDDALVLVLYGDVPLVGQDTLQRLVSAAEQGVALLTADLHDATGYGRVLRDDAGNVAGVVEDKDATPEQRELREINTGLLASSAASLRKWLGRVDNHNAQGEYYLPDILAMAVAEGVPVVPVQATSVLEVMGVNNKHQLAQAERFHQKMQAETCMNNGLTLLDPARFDLRGDLAFGRDCSVDVNVVLEGTVRLGSNVTIGAHCCIRNTEIGDGCRIEPHTHIDGATVQPDCTIGPFARVRPETRLAKGAKVGNFVETKKVTIGAGSKVNHLSYIGDARLGSGVNIGAGCITCNYDGVNKHQTEIGDNAFIGSDCQLVAPVKVGADATIGAGSTISRDAPEGQLTLTRARQKTIESWKRPEGKKEK